MTANTQSLYTLLMGLFISSICNAATGGLGIALSRDAKNGDLVVVGLLRGSPAAQSGLIKKGDRIVGVWETPEELVRVRDLTFDMTFKELERLIQGEPGTMVTLRIIPVGEAANHYRDITLVRRELPKLGSPAIRPTIRNLAYANKSAYEKLDLYLPASRGAPAPLVIWIHGGGLTIGDGDKSEIQGREFGPRSAQTDSRDIFQDQVPDVIALLAKGYAVASLNYRLGTSMITAAVPAIRDAKAAVRFLRTNAHKYNLDPNRFAAWGNSAGGYLAVMLGVTGDQPSIFDDPTLGDAGASSAVEAVVIWFGAANFVTTGNELSIARYLPTAKNLPAFKIANGDADTVVSSVDAQRLQEALVKAGATSTLTILHGAVHGDRAFMATQMIPTFAFLDKRFGR